MAGGRRVVRDVRLRTNSTMFSHHAGRCNKHLASWMELAAGGSVGNSASGSSSGHADDHFRKARRAPILTLFTSFQSVLRSKKGKQRTVRIDRESGDFYEKCV